MEVIPLDKDLNLMDSLSYTIRMVNKHKDFKKIYAELFNTSNKNEGVEITNLIDSKVSLSNIKEAFKDDRLELSAIRITANGNETISRFNFGIFDVKCFYEDESCLVKKVQLASKISAYQYNPNIVEFGYKIDCPKKASIDFGINIFPSTGLDITFIFKRK